MSAEPAFAFKGPGGLEHGDDEGRNLHAAAESTEILDSQASPKSLRDLQEPKQQRQQRWI